MRALTRGVLSAAVIVMAVGAAGETRAGFSIGVGFGFGYGYGHNYGYRRHHYRRGYYGRPLLSFLFSRP